MITEKQVVDYLQTKGENYTNRLISTLNFNLQSNIDIKNDSIKKICPICGSSSTKKNGKDRNGNQRYICKDCHKTFCDRTGTIYLWSHLSENQWKNLVDLEITGTSLKEESYYTGLSVKACFFNRHKIYRAATEIINQQQLSENVEVDAQFLKINLKGTKPENMPRFSKRRGSKSAYSGISHHKVTVICAVDSNDHMIMNITGLGNESFDKYKQNEQYFNNVEKVISDNSSSIKQFANHLTAESDYIPTSPIMKRYLTDDGESLGTINELMEEVRLMIRKTRGFSTRFGQGYINFNILKKQTHYQYERKDMASKILDAIKYTGSFAQRAIKRTVLPISLKEAYYEYRYGIFAD